MKRIVAGSLVFLMIAVVFAACADTIRYSKKEAGADNFRPRTIGLLSIDVGPREEIEGVIDRIVTEELARTGRYHRVLSLEDIIRLTGEGEASTLRDEYLSKLEVVYFSDPDISRRLGEIYGVDAFLLVSVSFWSYTVDTKEKDIAKVGLEMRLVEASSGRILWTGHHFEEERYRIFKPDLADVGSSVARRLVGEMPR